MDTARNVKDNSFAHDFFRGSFEIIDPTETNISLDVKIIDFKSNGFDKIKKIDSGLFAKRTSGDLESLMIRLRKSIVVFLLKEPQVI